ncbi:uncharacterized protein [Palaemon carinicauda]|uniref:uncharacterized protein n=1 Tax=Palaemon carinicauda TaxID=392227 RepID=UPI0035B5DD26
MQREDGEYTRIKGSVPNAKEVIFVSDGYRERKILDVLSEEIGNVELWELLYADDLAMTVENEEELQSRIMEWIKSLERGSLRVNMDKTETMVNSNEGRDLHESRDAVIKQVELFRYQGSTINQEGGCEVEVENRIKAAWGKLQEVPEWHVIT